MFRLRYFVFCMWNVLFALSALLAVMTPSDVLHHEWAEKWVESILTLIPELLDVPNESHAVQVVPFYHATMIALMLVFVPLSIFGGVRLPSVEREKIYANFPEKMKWVWIFVISIVGVCGALIVLKVGYVQGKGSILWYSRFHLFFGGYLPYLVIAFSSYCAAVAVCGFREYSRENG